MNSALLLSQSSWEIYFGLGLSIVLTVFEVLGVLSAAHAVMSARTSQGAIAWAICLLVFPIISVFAYWTFGRSKFEGYVKSRRAGNSEIHEIVMRAARLAHDQGLVSESKSQSWKVFRRLARMPFTCKNKVDLLINGEQTFAAIFQKIEEATEYVLVQFFIVHDDEIGNELKDLLIKKASAGVAIYFLYDEIGCHKLTSDYIQQLTDAGVEIRPFNTSRRNRFQINFRNHRKILIADGKVAFVGGLNVGDEYLGRSTRFGHWRDTHAQLVGPSVHATQLSFLEDWYWATHEVPDLDWQPRPAPEGDQDVLILPTGPADSLESCGLFFVQLINAARERCWIASPYFVPDLHVISALQLAALRGVDVRILLPQKPDHVLVYLSAFSFLGETESAGVKIYRYQEGFLHHKVALVDNHLSAVGTANLDNRSFRLNFEITALIDDEAFAAQMKEMFEADFRESKLATTKDLSQRPLMFQVAVKFARLMAPLQ